MKKKFIYCSPKDEKCDFESGIIWEQSIFKAFAVECYELISSQLVKMEPAD